MSIVNLTVCEIEINGKIFPACSHDIPVVKSLQDDVQFGIIDGIPIFQRDIHTQYLPEYSPGCYLIVTKDVAMANPDRKDLLVFDRSKNCLVRLKF